MSKFEFVNPLRSKLRTAGGAAYGLWITLESATVTEICAETGFDWVCVDMEHGSLDYKDVLQHLRAARGSDLAVIVRVPSNTADAVKRVLDLGAHGVMLPLISSAEELRFAMNNARYPAAGTRGIGGERSAHWGLALEQYVAAANRETMVIPLIETVAASRAIGDILAVEGLETIFFGPADLSQSYGHMAVWEGPGVAEDIVRMTDLAIARGIAPGIIGRGFDDVARREAQGFRMIGLGSDVGLLLGQIREKMKRLKGEALESAWF